MRWQPQKVTLSGIGRQRSSRPTSFELRVVAIGTIGTLKPPKTVTLDNVPTPAPPALEHHRHCDYGTNVGDFFKSRLWKFVGGGRELHDQCHF